MFGRRIKQIEATVEYISGKGVKRRVTTFKPHPHLTNVYTIMDGPSNAIRITIKEHK